MTARLAGVIRCWLRRAARWRGRRGRDRRRWPRFPPDSRRRRFSMPRWVTPVPDGRWRTWPPLRSRRACRTRAGPAGRPTVPSRSGTSTDRRHERRRYEPLSAPAAGLPGRRLNGRRGLRREVTPADYLRGERAAGLARVVDADHGEEQVVGDADRQQQVDVDADAGHRRRGCGRCAAPVMAGDVLSPRCPVAPRSRTARMLCDGAAQDLITGAVVARDRGLWHR